MTECRRHPVLPLRELVVFPGERVPLRVGREASVQAIEEAFLNGGRELVLVSQVDRRIDDPSAADVFTIGVLARVLLPKKWPKGGGRVLRVEVEALRRVRILDLGCDERGYFGRVEAVEVEQLPLVDARELGQTVLSKLNEMNRFERGRYPTAELLLEERIGGLLDTTAAFLDLELLARQELLEELDLRLRGQAVLMALEVELAAHRHEQRRAERSRRRERGSEGTLRNVGSDQEIDELRAQVAEAELPDAARDRLERELARLEKMHVMSAEANVLRTWVEQILQVPWGRFSEDRIGLADAARLLDADHHGLADPKDRILEHLAVRSQSRNAAGPVLCLVGPPGVGKTSLARSVAAAMGRDFVRVALGGVADEAQVRGHRRTYVGALPGRIVGALQRAGTMNPVLLLDEIDKLSSNLRGDPAAALLEVLDPEQNHAFRDHYMELGIDLSQVLFLCTANRQDRLPAPLLDRLEVLRLSGYSEEEKIVIAQKHLVPRQLKDAGFREGQVRFTRPALLRMVRDYTRESGVRGLERTIARCARRLTRECLEKQSETPVGERGAMRLGPSRVERYLGPALPDRQLVGAEFPVGVSFGLAWSQVGGDVLRIEAVRVPGRGRLKCTGQLGDIMNESAALALSFLRAHAERLGLGEQPLADHDLHVHVPDGAQPKDGPSAGLALALAMYSCLSRDRLPNSMACTGELTLTGMVLPVGGLREKILAAQRHGLARVFYPRANHAQILALSSSLRRQVDLVPVATFTEVLSLIGRSQSDHLADVARYVDA